jgi:hypothetical protein
MLHGAAAAACPGPALQMQDLGAGLWWIVAASDADADEHNRGHVSHLLLGEDGARVWLLGSGPSPAFARRLACQVHQHFGKPITDVISPWPRPELVLGLAGLGRLRSWAHADVAQAMRQRCPGCVARLKTRLGAAAGDLGTGPVRLPQRLLRGEAGRLGPWRWWRLTRSPGYPVTVWQWQPDDAIHVPRYAPGLLWGSGVPDGRDAQLGALAQATAALARAGAPFAAGAVAWLGEQGSMLAADAPQAHSRYWQLLLAAVRAAQARGDVDSGIAPPIEGLSTAQQQDPRHTLNWQRAWRQTEAEPVARPAASASGPQRSLR